MCTAVPIALVLLGFAVALSLLRCRTATSPNTDMPVDLLNVTNQCNDMLPETTSLSDV